MLSFDNREYLFISFVFNIRVVMFTFTHFFWLSISFLSIVTQDQCRLFLWIWDLPSAIGFLGKYCIYRLSAPAIKFSGRSVLGIKFSRKYDIFRWIWYLLVISDHWISELIWYFCVNTVFTSRWHQQLDF